MRVLAVLLMASFVPPIAACGADPSCSTSADCPQGRICRVGLCALDPNGGDGQADGETFSDVPLNCSVATSTDLVLNEILADPPANADIDGNGVASATEDEFVEIVNVSAREVALSNVEVDVNGKRVALGHLCLGVNQARVIFGSSGLPSLTNTSGAVSLVVDGNVVQSHTYGSERGKDSSLTLLTQLDPTSLWVLHKEVWGTPYSNGKCSNGNDFPDCEGGTVTPDAEVADGPGEVVADCSQTPVAGDLVINEVMADPGSGVGGQDGNGDGVVDSGDDEFVEIVNVSGATLRLDGVKLSDSGTKTFAFPAACVAPFQAIVVFGRYQGTGSFPGVLTFSGGGLSLNNSDDGVTLRDQAGAVLAQMTYGSEAEGDQSIVRATDLDPTAPFVRHSLAPSSGGRMMSPGTCQNGHAFPDCAGPGEVEAEADVAAETLETVDGGDAGETVDDVGPTCGPAPVAGDLVINEVLFDPPGTFDANLDGTPNTTQDEFVEIVNASGGALNLLGVKLGDASNAANYTFGALCLGSHEALVVYGKGAHHFALTGLIVLDALVHSLSLNNTPPETVRLTGQGGELLASETFTVIPADQSSVRAPDVTGAFVGHTTVVAGAPASPGKCLSGATFPACLAP